MVEPEPGNWVSVPHSWFVEQASDRLAGRARIAVFGHKFLRVCVDQDFTNFFAHVQISINMFISRNLSYNCTKFTIGLNRPNYLR